MCPANQLDERRIGRSVLDNIVADDPLCFHAPSLHYHWSVDDMSLVRRLTIACPSEEVKGDGMRIDDEPNGAWPEDNPLEQDLQTLTPDLGDV